MLGRTVALPGQPGATGHQAHVGNRALAGDVYPAMVVGVLGGFANGGTSLNLQVFPDGNDTYWAISRPEGDQPGAWRWPPRV